MLRSVGSYSKRFSSGGRKAFRRSKHRNRRYSCWLGMANTLRGPSTMCVLLCACLARCSSRFNTATEFIEKPDAVNYIVGVNQNITYHCQGIPETLDTTRVVEDFDLYYKGQLAERSIVTDLQLANEFLSEYQLRLNSTRSSVSLRIYTSDLDSGYYACSFMQRYGNSRLWKGTSSASYLHVANTTTTGDVARCFLGSGRYGVLQAGKEISLSCSLDVTSLYVTFQRAGSNLSFYTLEAEEKSPSNSYFRIGNATVDKFNGTKISCRIAVDKKSEKVVDDDDLCAGIPQLVVLDELVVRLSQGMVGLRNGETVTFTCESDPPILSDIDWNLRETENGMTGNFSVSQSIGRSELRIENVQFYNASNSHAMKISCTVEVPLPPFSSEIPNSRGVAEATIYQSSTPEVFAWQIIAISALITAIFLCLVILLLWHFCFCRDGKQKQTRETRESDHRDQAHSDVAPELDEPDGQGDTEEVHPGHNDNEYIYVPSDEAKLTSLDYRRGEPQVTYRNELGQRRI